MATVDDGSTRAAAVLQGTGTHNTCGFLRAGGATWWYYPGKVGMRWYLQSERSKRSRKLYALAAEAAKAPEKR